MAKTSYVISLGSNRYRSRPPRETIARALQALRSERITILAVSDIRQTTPLGPGTRRYANAVAVIETDLSPPLLLKLCKNLEARFGRRTYRRWGDRALDIDVILWSGGLWADKYLTIPHINFRDRPFVLAPLAQIAPDWRDPVSSRTIAQIYHHHQRAIPVDPRAPAP